MVKTNRDQLVVSFVERWERIEEQIADSRAILKDLRREAKSKDLSAKHIAQMVRLRAKDPEKLREEDDIVEAYRHACGV